MGRTLDGEIGLARPRAGARLGESLRLRLARAIGRGAATKHRPSPLSVVFLLAPGHRKFCPQYPRLASQDHVQDSGQGPGHRFRKDGSLRRRRVRMGRGTTTARAEEVSSTSQVPRSAALVVKEEENNGSKTTSTDRAGTTRHRGRRSQRKTSESLRSS